MVAAAEKTLLAASAVMQDRNPIIATDIQTLWVSSNEEHPGHL